jgi:hypothetical protein
MIITLNIIKLTKYEKNISYYVKIVFGWHQLCLIYWIIRWFTLEIVLHVYIK